MRRHPPSRVIRHAKRHLPKTGTDRQAESQHLTSERRWRPPCARRTRRQHPAWARSRGRPRGGADRFHAIKLANAVVDQVRRRVQQATLGHLGRKPDPLYRIRKLLLTAAEQLTSQARVRLRAGLAVGDPTGEVAVAWQGQGAAAYGLCHQRPGSRPGRAGALYRWSDGVGVAELSRLARTVRAWEAEILAWHATGGCSNGPTEAVNLLIKKVKRVGHGFRNFANYRLRLLLHCGVRWQTHRTARLRRRSPRLVA
jgi:transposase